MQRAPALCRDLVTPIREVVLALPVLLSCLFFFFNDSATPEIYTRIYPCSLFFFNDTATTEIYTLSLHDALPIFAALRAPDLVAPDEHRDAAREQEDRKEVLDLSGAQRANRWIVAGTFCAAVPTEVFVDAVAVALAVRFVVFLVVRHEIVQREAVVRRHEIDAVDR